MKKPVEIKREKNLILPADNSLSIEELISELNMAENGPFITVQEGMKDFEQWLQSRENK